MNTQLLESFLVVAAERNITRAAARLHLTQQTLSAQIRQLERTLGAVLLVRDSRGVRLTAAGQVFADGAKTVLADLATLVEDVRAVDAQSPEVLRVVYCARATAPFMIRVADAMEAATPAVRVELISLRTMREGVRILDEGRADAGFLWFPVAGAGLRHLVIGAERWVAAVSPSHRLAGRAEVTLADLTSETVVLPAIFASEAAERHWLAGLGSAGGGPAPIIRDIEDGPTLVARRQGIWLAPESLARRYLIDGIRLLPVSDAPRIDAAVVWNSRAPEPLIGALIDTVRAEQS